MTQTVDKWGRVIFDEDGLFELIYSDVELSSDIIVQNCDEVERYNKLCEYFDMPTEKVGISFELGDPVEYHKNRQNTWFIPTEFDIDIKQHLLNLCSNEAETNRVTQELAMYEDLGATKILVLFNYIVSTLRANNVVWGVGRGSSVASYCLYLLGVHRVDSIKYGLDIREFLREG